MKLFLSATNVTHRQGAVFTGKEIRVDAVLASACLPFMFQAVEIDGEHYWDGGYSGNPAIFPLYLQLRRARHRAGADQPAARPELPTTAPTS